MPTGRRLDLACRGELWHRGLRQHRGRIGWGSVPLRDKHLGHIQLARWFVWCAQRSDVRTIPVCQLRSVDSKHFNSTSAVRCLQDVCTASISECILVQRALGLTVWIHSDLLAQLVPELHDSIGGVYDRTVEIEELRVKLMDDSKGMSGQKHRHTSAAKSCSSGGAEKLSFSR